MNDKRQKNQHRRIWTLTPRGGVKPKSSTGRDRIVHGELQTESPAGARATDGGGLRAGKLSAGFTTSEGQ